MLTVNDSLLLRAARGESTERPPLWLMRQAGRCDPAYRELRASSKLHLEELFRHPELAARISLLPARWGVDGLIIFQDILSPLAPMGAPFIFRPGPQLERPSITLDRLRALRPFDMAAHMSHIAAIYRGIASQAGASMPLIGFAGAPLTLLAFLTEEGSPAVGMPRLRRLLSEHPQESRDILDTLAKMTVDYLQYQIDCGAHLVQLFESCAYELTRQEYGDFALPAQQYVFNALKGKVPTIAFARLADRPGQIEDMAASGADILSIPGDKTIAEARAIVGAHAPIQGNLDNRLLVSGPLDAIAAAAKECIEGGQCTGHIFNLNHGVLPDTPFEHVKYLVDYIRAYTKSSQP
ncbi:MAG: uroporphyrinogen decarboxylase [Candidatus Hydrogenedentes bacterium]|nr:uroporphyrinogen decarboxylase [Candidatus Hydrogenedentota bacterium]